MVGTGPRRRMDTEGRPTALVAGATGYVGARLVPRLAAKGYHVRAMGRSKAKLRSRPWAHDPNIEPVVADVLHEGSIDRVLEGVDVVYYLIHSMTSKRKGFEKADLDAAHHVREACARAGVKRIVYLSGLGEDDPELSPHLRSRAEVARVFREGPVPATVLRAAVILGSGSASFEILRFLTDRLPVMITPRWLSTPVQPIAIRNVLGYLVGCLDAPETMDGTFDIGGPEVMTYRELMDIYAEVAGLRKRAIFTIPVLTPKLSTYWIQLVTPAPASLIRPLAEGLRNPMVCRDDRIRALVPQDLLTCREAIEYALQARQLDSFESHWTDAGPMPPAAWALEGDEAWTGESVIKDQRTLEVDVPPADAWEPIARIGGKAGWYYADALWFTRGAVDSMVGGVGTRRGRPHPRTLRPGDALDFWRVAHVEPGHNLRLVAEMKLPGEAVLDLRVDPHGPHGSRITQTAYFRPHGVAGLAYWYVLYPFHALIFRGMLRGIAKRAEERVKRPSRARAKPT